MTVRLSPRSWAALCAALMVAPLLVLASHGEAATRVVTLSSSGPSPASVSIARGDTVTFRNADSVSHTIRRTSGAWSYDKTIAPGASAVTPAFAAAGSYGYEDRFTLTLIPRTETGSITVTATKPTPTRSPTASPRPSPSRSPTAGPGPSGTASPSATPTSSGLAISPGIGIGTVPPILGPTPNLAPPVTAGPTTTPSAGVIAYGNQSSLVQSSPHRYGLPMALALLLALGVLSLIVRVLLSL